jgi:hypothetical protein
MTSTSLAVQAAPGTGMVVHAPSDDATRRAMEQLVAAGSPQPRFPCWPAHQAGRWYPSPSKPQLGADHANTVRDLE